MAEPKKGASLKDDSAMRVDAALVQELAELLTTNALTEIEVEDGDRKIRVARHAAPGAAPTLATAPAPTAPAPAQSLAAAPASEEDSGETIKSPMVGTAFLSAEPGAKPFVEPGDTVKTGDTLLIIEAMKVMNTITAPAGGVVKKVLVGDGQPVEFDQPLIVID
jgi:acetyl-CoA carboxylase biotin carboxyl carrier protein